MKDWLTSKWELGSEKKAVAFLTDGKFWNEASLQMITASFFKIRSKDRLKSINSPFNINYKARETEKWDFLFNLVISSD